MRLETENLPTRLESAGHDSRRISNIGANVDHRVTSVHQAPQHLAYSEVVDAESMQGATNRIVRLNPDWQSPWQHNLYGVGIGRIRRQSPEQPPRLQ